MPQPYIKFYFRDWEADAELMACSLAARGLWVHIMRVMHESPRYGYFLARTGEEVDLKVFARRIGCTINEVSRGIGELEEQGVFSRDAENRIYSRRMIREADKKVAAAAFGKMGGNPTLIPEVNPLPYPPDLTKGLTPGVKPHGNNHSHSHSQIPKTIVFGTAWLKNWTTVPEDHVVADPASWLDGLGLAFAAIAGKELVTLSVAEREILARVHAAILGNANADESKNIARGAALFAPIARLCMARRFSDLTPREYVQYGLKVLEKRRGKPFWNPFDVEAAFEYEPATTR